MGFIYPESDESISPASIVYRNHHRRYGLHHDHHARPHNHHILCENVKKIESDKII